jgi:catechol 2,3-dioxygenase-like lactoylglutathione lyase family enzyme
MRALGNGVVVMFALIGVIATVEQLRSQATAPLQEATFNHIGIVVPDMAKAAQMFADIYGVVPPPMPRVYDNNGKGLPFPAGVNGNKAATAKLMQFTVGDVRIELIEPSGGPNAWKDHLDKYGTSVHHLAFRVGDVDTAIHALEAKGGKWVLGEGGNSFAYVDLKDQLGFAIELGRQQPPATPAR